ncbi:MAG: pilus assembly protein TadG-related protein, partial [Filomicrobium sp.]
MTGLLMPVVIGGFGLGGEVSYWYFTQRKLQNAADVAAYAGAVQLRPGQDQNAIESAALAAALKTGYRSSIGAITTNSPAVTGAFAGVANTVEATVREDVPRLFTSLFLTGDVPISGRAVARVTQQQPACILALHKNKSRAAKFTGSSNVILEGCSVHANSVATDA